ncbi:hypothetical protein KBY55_29120 [Streptomyces sp. b94]|uniref:hypothetical protein n=1 Tax=Streptomyces sp. b94 TaxID=1827634 RepID=UPI001B382FE1|nr:hypothetical protein [Streptomyces sp. b94]MBQ1100010.1 hypothetical protein [Streptomyces sp. b94]
MLDRLDGGIARAPAAEARLDPGEAFRDAGGWLDAYAGSLHRSVKDDRDGHPIAVRPGAADSARFLLPGWATGPPPGAVDRAPATGDGSARRRLFTRVEAVARAAGHGAVPDAWGEELDLMRPE